MRRRAVGATTVLLLVAGSLTACSGGRSVEAFCNTYWEEKQAYVAKYEAAADTLDGETDPMAGLLGGAIAITSALGDVVVMFDKLEKHAPEEIQSDVAMIRDSLRAQLDAMSGAADNPVGAFAGSLLQGLVANGSWERVGSYVVEKCGETGPA